MIEEDGCCPPGVCVTCASAALAAQEFRLFVINSEQLWHKAVFNLTDLEYLEAGSAKSLCAFVEKNDMTVEMTKDYTGGEPKTVVNRSKNFKKTQRKTRTPRGGPTVSCPDCQKAFTSPYFLHVHLKNSGQKDVCLLCGEITLRGKVMKDHMRDAHSVNAFLCQKCPAMFIKKEDYKKHCKKGHSPNAYSCSECGRTFLRLSSLEIHFQMHAVSTCRKCGLQFTNRSCYRAHRKGCEPGAKILSKGRSTNRDQAVFICDYCNKTYTTRPELKNHIIWIHMDVRPHQCQWCGKRFNTITRLTEHTVVHTRARNFECDICGAKLVSKLAVVYHRRRHTGEKPFKCDDCDARFISSSRRLEHAKRKHNKGIRLPCTHPSCNATFVRKSELNKHIAKAHDPKKNSKSWSIVYEQEVETILPN